MTARLTTSPASPRKIIVMMIDPFPNVSGERKAHALSLTVGRYLTTPALIQHFTLEQYLSILAVIIEIETKRLVESRGETLEALPPMNEEPSLAQQLILRWKSDQTVQAQFASFLDYCDAVESTLERGPMNPALLP